MRSGWWDAFTATLVVLVNETSITGAECVQRAMPATVWQAAISGEVDVAVDDVDRGAGAVGACVRSADVHEAAGRGQLNAATRHQPPARRDIGRHHRGGLLTAGLDAPATCGR